MTKSRGPLFYTSKTVPKIDRSQIVSIKTGFKELDKQIIGLNKGETSIISGLTSSGKSSILSQIALEVVDRRMKCAIFSGELHPDRVMNWVRLQSAGQRFTKQHPRYEKHYEIESEEIEDMIDDWLSDKLYLYNNDYGRKVEELLMAVEDCIENKGIDFVILDNLMTVDLGTLNTNQINTQQKSFILEVKQLAENSNVHIVLVAHPRKTMGVIRLLDISGTADLGNIVDNVFLIHRVNESFKRSAQEYFNWKETSDMFNFDNIIEVAKNRDFGVQDFLVGVYYEPSSKRFKNEPWEDRVYGWETSEGNARLPYADGPSPFEL